MNLKTKAYLYAGIGLLLLYSSCKNREKATALFSLVENSGITFSNTISNTKEFNIFSYRNFYNGGGVAIGDLNNDGLPEVFFTSNMESNKLYLNKGKLQFEDISSKSGFQKTGKWATGVVFVDVNGDGWLDIYVCNAGYINGRAPENELYINNHDLTFIESAEEYGLTNRGGYSTHASFFDYDLDGDLDAFIINNSFIPVNTLNYANKRELRAKDWPVADFLKGGGDRLLRNDNGKFTDVSELAGIHGSLISFGLGVTVGDINGDHYPDVYVSNDFFERDYLYINQQNGTFKDDLENRMQHISHSSMGADIGDVNNDGYPDIFTTDMLPDDDFRLKTTSTFQDIDINRLTINSGFYNQYMQNTLQVNNKNGRFVETGYYSGIAASDWSWGGLIFDADNDGLSDIYVCNGIYNDVTDQDFIDFFANDVIQRMVMTGKKDEIDQVISKMPSHPILNKAYRNTGSLRFTDEGNAWGFTQPSFSNGAAYGDLDNDGDLDLVISNVNQKAFLYQNNTRKQGKNNYIAITLKTAGLNRFAIGSTIKLFQGDQVITREVMPSRGFQSSMDYKMIIGLGQGKIDSMLITWPDRSSTLMKNPAINQQHIITAENSEPPSPSPVNNESPLFMEAKQQLPKHIEDDYVDFYYERGIPMMLSREGPKLAEGDVNGDGLTDMYICGAANQGGQLFLQSSAGFVPKPNKAFSTFAAFEDVCAVLFDIDKDGDLDLFVGSGGNHRPVYGFEYQNRIYKNDGKGNFEFSPTAIPNTGMNTSVAAANDFDHDGDIDLFVGSRNIPQNYGLNPENFLFVNDGLGNFTDISRTSAKEVNTAGMITAATWTDITGDNNKELVLLGDWMAPKVFTYKDNHFVLVNTNLADLAGWWRSIASADLDGDGDQDLVLGNVGENFYLHPDKTNPVKMFISDFDNNGTMEKIITRSVGGTDKPVYLKRELADQIASLRKQNLKHGEFASKSIEQLFPADELKKAVKKQFNYSSSCIAYNDGDGNFTVKKLPYMVQLSSVNAIHIMDINNDKRPDLILGGNDFTFQPQFSRLDASYGHVLLNEGKGRFEWMGPEKSGFNVRGQIRDIKQLSDGTNAYLLILQNNDLPVMLKRSTAEKVKEK